MTIRPTKGKAGIKGFTWDIYIIAFVITCVIFFLGVYTGHTLVHSELDVIHNSILSMDADSSLMQIILMNSIMDTGANFNCVESKQMADSLENDIWTIGQKLTDIENSGGMNYKLKTEYMTLEYRNYLINEIIKNRCNESTNTILYFYSNKPDECKTCEKEGYILSDVRSELIKNNQSIKIYSFDMNNDIDSRIINILKDKYNITVYPTLIINDKKIPGFETENTLAQHVQNKK